MSNELEAPMNPNSLDETPRHEPEPSDYQRGAVAPGDDLGINKSLAFEEAERKRVDFLNLAEEIITASAQDEGYNYGFETPDEVLEFHRNFEKYKHDLKRDGDYYVSSISGGNGKAKNIVRINKSKRIGK